MYIGPITEDAPTARPPMKRKNMNEYQFTIAALPTAEMKYRRAMTCRDRSRPKRLAGRPQKKAPMMVPIRAVAIVKPCAKSDSPYIFWMAPSAPEMTAVSKPKSRPPRDATKAIQNI